MREILPREALGFVPGEGLRVFDAETVAVVCLLERFGEGRDDLGVHIYYKGAEESGIIIGLCGHEVLYFCGCCDNI